MSDSPDNNNKKNTHVQNETEKLAGHYTIAVLPRLVFTVLIVLAGVFVMKSLASMWEAPPQAEVKELAITVNTMTVTPEDVPVQITGYGQARSRDVVSIAPEIPGNVVAIHPNLEVGEMINKGETLLKIDERNYTAALQQAQAQVTQATDQIKRLKRQFAIDQERLGTMRRSRTLAKNDFDRANNLFTNDEVGTQSGVDKMEMAFNQADDALDQMQQAIELYPIRIREAESGLQAAEAGLELAQANLERTEIKAPFNARIKQVQVEQGQFISPGAPIVVLADDSLLEISVPLDSRDAKSWLVFENGGTADDAAWFGELKPVECTIAWTESPEAHQWKGTLDRVQEFDQTTRTITVAVRVDAKSASGTKEILPLVDGMFCQVTIPGQTLTQVYRLPSFAVSFNGEVLLADGDRLRRQVVEVVRNEGIDTYVRTGLQPGDQVITTRLVNPQPNALLRIVDEDRADNTTSTQESAS